MGEILKGEKKGITLIALVITIIILLILAAVTIAALSGDNGILNNAAKAKKEQAHSSVAEGISLAYNEYVMEIYTSDAEETKEIAKIASTQTVQVQGKYERVLLEEGTTFLEFLLEEKEYINEEGIVNVEKLLGQKLLYGNGTDGETDVYKIEKIGTKYTLKYYEDVETSEILWEINTSSTEEINWEEIFQTATKHPEQSESNTAIGIGAKGEPVNMDYWTSVKDNNTNTYILQGEDISGALTSAYTEEFTENGEIKGVMPQYIKKDGDATFIEVTSLTYTFAGCTDLKIAPEIPSTVTSMSYTFYRCTALKEVSNIPDSVTDMDMTFGSCTSLEKVPHISDNVTYMRETFSVCTSLKTVPNIPDSVNNMDMTFYGCTSLETVPEIPSTVTDMLSTFRDCSNLQGEIKIKRTNSYLDATDCFLDAATSGKTLTLVGSNEDILKELQATGGENSKIEYRVEE